MHESLFHKPPMGRLMEMLLELLFEGRRAATAFVGQLFYRSIRENVAAYDMLEVTLILIRMLEYFLLQTAIGLRYDKVNQLGQFQVISRIVIAQRTVLQVIIYRIEEILGRFPRRIYNIPVILTVGTTVVIAYLKAKIDAQTRKCSVQLLGSIIENYLFERMITLGNILGIVKSDTHEEDLSRLYHLTAITVIDIFMALKDIAQTLPGKVVRLYSIAAVVNVFNDYGLLCFPVEFVRHGTNNMFSSPEI